MKKASPHKRKAAEARGRRAEKIAAWYLRCKGYQIIDERFRSKRGEIDLIAKRGTTTVFVEVKARKDVVTAAESITYRQRRRIEAAAEDWIKHTGHSSGSLRFDIILVVPRAIPTHISDAWRVGD
ncbi:MAG: hypothetical protein COB37_03695 [Kordiimonadales bacterium]|nr:MAG: hypothetical protein COB37_03695 [Kordiimonadales bacterium]